MHGNGALGPEFNGAAPSQLRADKFKRCVLIADQIGTEKLMDSHIETCRQPSGEWTATIPSLPGLKAYGASREEALARARDLGTILAAEDRVHRPKPHRILAFYPWRRPVPAHRRRHL